jgi:hypothetical protein
MGYTNAKYALSALGDAVLAVRMAETRLQEAQDQVAKFAKQVDVAREKFNTVRDEVIEMCPEILDGYSKETVKVVDGKITVVEEDESA